MFATFTLPPDGSGLLIHSPDVAKIGIPEPGPQHLPLAQQPPEVSILPYSLVQDGQPDGGSRVLGMINTERERISRGVRSFEVAIRWRPGSDEP